MTRFVVESLADHHDRTGFSCGIAALDRYLAVQAGQDMRRRIANCFVAVPDGAATIAGYYTLSAASLPMLALPEVLSRRLPRYPVLPAALIGRLAVRTDHAGKGLGAALLFDAIRRAGRADPAVYAMLVDAKDESAAAFYAHHGFAPFADRPLSLYLPMATAARLLG